MDVSFGTGAYENNMKLIRVYSEPGSGTNQIGTYEAMSGKQTHVSFRTDARVPAPQSTDHFFIVGALAAFLQGESYTHQGLVSEGLIESFRQSMETWSNWWDYRPIEITAQTGSAPNKCLKGKRSGCLMSGGVDSLFSAIQLRDEIDVFVNILHCKSEQPNSLLNRPHDDLADLAQSMDKTLLRIETNVMSAFPAIEDVWSSVSHGPCLAAVGHFLSSELSGMRISASFAHDQLQPWGSHPTTDKNFSSGGFRFEHSGAAYNRLEKHRVIADHPELLRYLSVCEQGPQAGAKINCGKCQKCLRSMITLDLLDVNVRDAPTFDWDDYDPQDLKKFLLQGHVNCSELLAFAEEIERDDIAEILRDVIAYADRYRWIVQLELYARRRFNWLVRFKPLLKRLRVAVYALMNIRPRRL